MKLRFWKKSKPSNLQVYARDELERAGWFDKNGMYDGMIGHAVMRLIDTHSAEGHSGGSHAIVMALFTRVAEFKPLSPLTYAEDEWHESVEGLLQNRRNSAVFSDDDLNTWYDLDEPGRPRHSLLGDDYE